MVERMCGACDRPLEPDAPAKRRVCRRADCQRDRSRRSMAKSRGEVVDFPGGSAQRGSLADAVRESLTEAGRVEDWQGRAALQLAERIDASVRESGSAYAALVAKLETSMELALRPKPGESFADELRAKRQARVRGA